MSLSTEVIDYIQSSELTSPTQLRASVRETFGIEVSPVTVLQVLNDNKRRKNIQNAQATASERLEHKVDLTEEIIKAYVDMVKDETLDLKQRLMAMRDLRGWVKLAMEAAGDAGPSNSTMFAIAPEWDLGFGPN